VISVAFYQICGLILSDEAIKNGLTILRVRIIDVLRLWRLGDQMIQKAPGTKKVLKILPKGKQDA
jgi:hypothetical protein